MKLRISLCIVLLFLLVQACDRPWSANMNSVPSEFPQFDAMTEDELEGAGILMAKSTGGQSHAFVQLAHFLASNKKWLKKENIPYTAEKGLPIGYLVDEAPSSYVAVDGRFFTIKIELYTKQYKDLVQSKGSFSYAIALDADLFHRHESVIPALRWNSAKKQVEWVEIPMADPDQEERWSDARTIRDQLDFPVFFISLEQTFDDPAQDAILGAVLKKGTSIMDQDPCIDDNCSSSGSPGTTPPAAPRTRGTYFTIKSVNLFDKKDDSNDEFEFYIWPASSQTVNKTTAHKFSGTVRNDASGYPVYYRDVNGDQGWENHVDTVCIAKLDDGLVYHFIPIDDDETAGEHDYSHSSLRSKYITEYSFADALVRTGVVWTFSTDNDDDSDDIYTEAGLKNVSEQSYSTLVGQSVYLTTTHYIVNKLPDIDYEVAVRKW